jgi:hypothetical protein
LQLTADIWNDKMREQSGTILSSREFSLLRQGQAYLAPATGNYKNPNVNDHVPKNREIGSRKGGTIYDLHLDKMEEIAGKLVIRPTLNWYVQKDFVKSDIVIRELEHVSRWLFWQGGEGDGAIAIRNFNRNPTGIDKLKATMKAAKRDEDIWHEANIHGFPNRHDSDIRPGKKMNSAVIEDAILKVGPKEGPHIGNHLLGY